RRARRVDRGACPRGRLRRGGARSLRRGWHSSPAQGVPAEAARACLTSRPLRPLRPGFTSAEIRQYRRTARMAIEGQEIEDLIREAFPDAKITITDLAGDGNHWAAEV